MGKMSEIDALLREQKEVEGQRTQAEYEVAKCTIRLHDIKQELEGIGYTDEVAEKLRNGGG